MLSLYFVVVVNVVVFVVVVVVVVVVLGVVVVVVVVVYSSWLYNQPSLSLCCLTQRKAMQGCFYLQPSGQLFGVYGDYGDW